MMSVDVRAWHSRPADGGASVALDGERLAVGGTGRLHVFDGMRHVAAVDAPSPAPGMPRFVGDRVYWGPGFLDLASASYTVLEAALPQLVPSCSERASVYAWSPGADCVLVSFATPTHTRVSVLDGQSGRVLAKLFDEPGLPPQAAWVGQRAAVVGFGQPRVFDRTGELIAEIALSGGAIASIHGTADERHVLIADLNHALVWLDTEAWTNVDRWPGPWLTGAVSPDGRLAAALEPWGKLHLASLSSDRFVSLGQLAIDDAAISFALSDDRIATVGGGEVRWASLKRPKG